MQTTGEDLNKGEPFIHARAKIHNSIQNLVYTGEHRGWGGSCDPAVDWPTP